MLSKRICQEQQQQPHVFIQHKSCLTLRQHFPSEHVWSCVLGSQTMWPLMMLILASHATMTLHRLLWTSAYTRSYGIISPSRTNHVPTTSSKLSSVLLKWLTWSSYRALLCISIVQHTHLILLLLSFLLYFVTLPITWLDLKCRCAALQQQQHVHSLTAAQSTRHLCRTWW